MVSSKYLRFRAGCFILHGTRRPKQGLRAKQSRLPTATSLLLLVDWVIEIKEIEAAQQFQGSLSLPEQVQHAVHTKAKNTFIR
jgi:hypothetical protein